MSDEELWEHFEKCCRYHDWFYEYSDDHRYWVNGKKERGYLISLKGAMKDLDENRANKIYFGHNPSTDEHGNILKD